MLFLLFLRTCDKGSRPAAVGVDYLVDLFHDFDGFVDGYDNLVVMLNVLSR
jgi:hypothetical protein